MATRFRVTFEVAYTEDMSPDEVEWSLYDLLNGEEDFDCSVVTAEPLDTQNDEEWDSGESPF